MSEFEILENTLAQRIGVSQEKLREIRQNELKKEQDFSLVRGAIVYTAQAMNTVLEKLGLKGTPEMEKKDPPPPTPPAATPPTNTPEGPEALRRTGTQAVLVVVRFWRNPRILGAVPKDEATFQWPKDNGLLWVNGKAKDVMCPVADYIRRNLAALKEEYTDGIWEA